MYGSPARRRLEQESARRSSAPVVVTTLLSLFVVAAAVAAVAWLVLRSPSEAVDSAERLEVVGTALPAPTAEATLPTPIPTEPSEPAAPGFTGEAPAVSGLPTVAAPLEAESVPPDAGPTPTPRVLALPTAMPIAAATLPPAQPTPLPAPTLPPAVPVEAVPVVALQPVAATGPAPTTVAAPEPSETERERQPGAAVVDDDPFNIFGDENGGGSRILPAQNDALERVRAMQDDDDRAAERDDSDATSAPTIAPPNVTTITERRDGTTEIIVPDVDAMIEEITAQVTDPNRNPNVSANGDEAERTRERDGSGLTRDAEERDRDAGSRDGNRERESPARGSSSAENGARTVRERISERSGRETAARPDREVAPAVIVPRNDDGEDIGDDCFPFC